mgnify:CR=1 FL=1
MSLGISLARSATFAPILAGGFGFGGTGRTATLAPKHSGGALLWRMDDDTLPCCTRPCSPGVVLSGLFDFVIGRIVSYHDDFCTLPPAAIIVRCIQVNACANQDGSEKVWALTLEPAQFSDGEYFPGIVGKIMQARNQSETIAPHIRGPHLRDGVIECGLRDDDEL